MAASRPYAAPGGSAASRGCRQRSWGAVEQALRLGPQVFGFDTQLWTLRRVAVVIERLVGVRFHPGHVWRLLRRLDWSVPPP